MTINKTMINNYLNKKYEEALQKIENEFNNQKKAMVDEILKDERISVQLKDIASNYIVINDAVNELRGGLRDYYYDEHANLKLFGSYLYHDMEFDDLVIYFAEKYYECTEDYYTKQNMKRQMDKNVRHQYENLRENIKQLKANKALEYLKELGFDVSNLEYKKVDNYLAHNIDVKYLLLG